MSTQATRPTILVDRRGTRFHENENSDSKDVSDVGRLRMPKISSELLPGRHYGFEYYCDRQG
jgi:hypothetical protein